MEMSLSAVVHQGDTLPRRAHAGPNIRGYLCALQARDNSLPKQKQRSLQPSEGALQGCSPLRPMPPTGSIPGTPPKLARLGEPGTTGVTQPFQSSPLQGPRYGRDYVSTVPTSFFMTHFTDSMPISPIGGVSTAERWRTKYAAHTFTRRSELLFVLSTLWQPVVWNEIQSVRPMTPPQSHLRVGGTSIPPAPITRSSQFTFCVCLPSVYVARTTEITKARSIFNAPMCSHR